MVDLYKSGVFQTKITQLMHCKRETLLKALAKSGVKVLSKSERNRNVDFNPFNQQTDESYYWLGYFIADGNISKNENGISITSKDLDHLHKWHSYCKNPNKIQIRQQTGCGVSKFANKEVKDYLLSIGITPNKTFTINLCIPLNWSLVRGLFDGDGSISTSTESKTGRSHTTVYLITGSIALRQSLERFLSREGIEFTIQQHTSCWKIVIRARSREAFGQLIYKDASVFLERKQERYRPLLEQSSNDNRMNSGEVQADNPEPSCVE